MHMRKILILLSIHCACIHICYCQSPSITLILDNNRNWTSIVCPSIAASNDATNQVKSSDIEFQCNLIDQGTNLVDTPFHFTFFVELDTSITSKCPSIDECITVKLSQTEPKTIKVNAKTLKRCFSGKLKFRYELRHINRLVSAQSIEVVFGRKPNPPKQLSFRMNGTEILSLSGKLPGEECERDVLSALYVMKYEIRGEPGCQLVNHSNCHVFRLKGTDFELSCPLYTLCDSTAMCSAIVTAQVVGANRFGHLGDISRKFIKSLAFVTSRPITPNITTRTLNSLTVVFQKPVSCNAAYQHFQYKVSYKTYTSSVWVSVRDTICASEDQCSVYLAGLQMNTEYAVCIAYRNIFDLVTTYSNDVCTNASTAQLPCRAPTINEIIPMKIDNRFWRAIVHWVLLEDQDCWNDGLDGVINSTILRYYIVEVSDGNTTVDFKASPFANNSENGLSVLRYKHEYSVMLSSCNIYGCINGPRNYLFLKPAVHNTPYKPQQSHKQKVTETVLICVLSLLFLVASTILYLILRKQKQFHQRLRLKRKFTADDIQLVREDINFELNQVTSRGIIDTTATIIDNKEDLPNPVYVSKDEEMVIKIETRPLLACSIPENSTLV